MSVSDWYLNEATKLLEKAGKAKHNATKRKKALAALRCLIAYVAGKKGPEKNAIVCSDDATCDRCFKEMRYSTERLLCTRCERGVDRGGNARKPNARKLGSPKRPNRENKMENDPNHSIRIETHQKRVEIDLKRIGLEREYALQE